MKIENSSNQDKTQQSKIPAEELHQLEVFAGKWKIEGKNFSATPEGPETPVAGEDECVWLSGKFFMVDRWKHLSGGDGHQGISVLGFDETEGKLFTRNFDNLGFERKYFLVQANNSWKFVGTGERATREFSNDGKTYVENWEVLSDDNQWLSLCIMNGTKEE